MNTSRNWLLRHIGALLIAVAICAGFPTQAAPQDKPEGKDLTLVPASGPLAGRQIYTGSYALLVGIDRYQNLPQELWLQYAVNDVFALRDVLVKSYGFPADHVRVLTNDRATKANIEDALSDLADKSKIGPDDRILIYFSGHGQTVATAAGGDQGFLIPYDAKVDLNDITNAGPFLRTCVQMNTVWTYLDSSPAKHDLVIADACYSGLLASSRALENLKTDVLVEMASLRAMQVMTAGTKGQTSLEYPNLGHGAFTYKLLEQLKARADTPGSVFTATDLYARVSAGVLNLTDGKQYPKLGAHNATEGDFLFITTPPQPVPALSKTQVAPLPAPVTPTPPPTLPIRLPDDGIPTLTMAPFGISAPKNGDHLTAFTVHGTSPSNATVTLTIDVYQDQLFGKKRLKHDVYDVTASSSGLWQSKPVQYAASVSECAITATQTSPADSSVKPVSIHVSPPITDDGFPDNGHIGIGRHKH